MNIAVAADGKSLHNLVSEQFEQCLYLLIVNMNDLSVIVIKNHQLLANSSDENLANEVLKYDCEAVITGNINSAAFNVLADAGVTRFFGVGHSVQNALELMGKKSLEFIKNCDGTNVCDGHRH